MRTPGERAANNTAGCECSARPPFRDSLSHLRRRERPAGRSFLSRMLMRAQAADANDRIALCVAAQQPPYALSHVPHEALARCRDRELGSNSLSVMSFTPACTRDSNDAGCHDIVVPRHRRRHATAASSDFFCVSFGRRANGRVCRQAATAAALAAALPTVTITSATFNHHTLATADLAAALATAALAAAALTPATLAASGASSALTPSSVSAALSSASRASTAYGAATIPTTALVASAASATASLTAAASATPTLTATTTVSTSSITATARPRASLGPATVPTAALAATCAVPTIPAPTLPPPPSSPTPSPPPSRTSRATLHT